MTGANGFLKKNECTVVWAAFRDRNFEVGLPKAMSVPSKYNNFSHMQFLLKKSGKVSILCFLFHSHLAQIILRLLWTHSTHGQPQIP